MSNKSLSEKIEAGLSKQNELSGYESHQNAEGIINAVSNEINTKMMNGEALTEDDLKAISEVSNAFDIDPERFTRDYLEGMEAQGYDISSLQEKINSLTGAKNDVGASDTPLPKQEPKREKTRTPLGVIITKLKKALSLSKKAKKSEELNSLRSQVQNLLNSIEYSKLEPNELARVMDFEKPIYDTFGISISEIKKGVKFSSPKQYQQRQNKLDSIIGNMRPDDIIAQISGDTVGGDEYTQAEINISELKKKHSQKEINKHLKTLKHIGYIGVAVSFFVGIIGTHFDIVYHLPKMGETIGTPTVWILAIFLALLITVGIHIPLEGMVNKKYLDRTREILVIMLVVAVPLKIYIDYKAIKNYTKIVAEENRVKGLKDVTNSKGASIKTVEMMRANEEKNLERINSQLDQYTKQLAELQKKRKPHEDFIAKFSNKKKTKWRTEHIKIAREELRKLDNREASIQNHIDMLQKQQAEYMGAITKNANAVVGILKQSEVEAKDEADSRFYMLVALMAMIELASLLHVLSDFLRTRNTPVTLRELMEIQGAYDANKAVELIANRTKALINKGTIVSGEQALKGVEYQIWNGIRLQDSMLNSAHKMAEMSNQNTEKTVTLIAETVVARNNNINSEKLGRLVNKLIEDKRGKYE